MNGPHYNSKNTKSSLIRHFILLSAVALVFPQVGLAGDYEDLLNMPLKDLLKIKVQSSTFFDRAITHTPGYSWIFTQPEIRDSAAVYVKDIFDFYAPATTVSQTHFSGATTGVRGIATSNNAKSIFMYNGQSLNQKSHYGYQVGLESVLFGDVDRIEIIHGPGAMLHGSGAINGIVNLIPKNGREYSGFHTNIENGFKEGLRKVEIEYGNQYGQNNSYYFYAGAAKAKGFEPDSFLELGEPNTSTFDPNIDQQFKTYQLFDNYRLSSYIQHHQWEFQGQFQRVERSLNGVVLLDEDTVNRRHWQSLLATRLKYTWQLDSDTTIQFSMPMEFFDHGINFNEEEGDKGGRENHIALSTILHQEWTEHQFAAGFGVESRSFDPNKQYFESDKPLLEESMDGHLIESEIFCEDIWDISDRLSLLFGARFDHVTYSTLYDPESGVSISVGDLSALTKRVALNRQINEKQTFKVSYQEGFRYPDIAYYLYLGIINKAFTEAGLQTLPSLSEESVKGFEINYLHELENLPMSWDFNVYYNTHKGTLDWEDYSEEGLGTERYNLAREAIGFGPGSFANTVGSYHAMGFEIVNRWLPTSRLQIRASYGFSRPSGFERENNQNLELVSESSNRWASYPEHLLKLAITQKLSPHFMFNLSTYYASHVDICVTDCGGEKSLAELFHEKDRVRFNGKIRYSYDKQTHLSLIIHNLFADDGPAVGNASRGGTGALGGLGDDARRIYLSFEADL